jgi:hypothetical protein
MSFSELKVSELRKVADSFGVDTEGSKTKQEIIALLEEEGISYQMYAKFNGVEKEDIKIPEAEKKIRENNAEQLIASKNEKSVLVKMERMNHTYQVGRYTFSAQHPFVAMSESEAQRIFDTQPGFRLATPREAQEYYR